MHCVSSIADSRKSEDTSDFDVYLVQFWVVDMNVSAAVFCLKEVAAAVSIEESISSYRREIRRPAVSDGSVKCGRRRNHPRCSVGLREMGHQGKRGSALASWVMVRRDGDR